ncbi:hypothetical protein M988_3803 [Hafnia paralvei ATCC 29927]|nr:hypothetical protein [Hafnia paralvei]OAT37926.1 hypothetical protein M988_3803 [Hafnia paralvei ATCC 29927]
MSTKFQWDQNEHQTYTEADGGTVETLFGTDFSKARNAGFTMDAKNHTLILCTDRYAGDMAYLDWGCIGENKIHIKNGMLIVDLTLTPRFEFHMGVEGMDEVELLIENEGGG